MADHRRKFSREPASQRRDALIRATLALIAEKGVQAATVREIAKAANVTQGLIRHYFSTKEELVSAAYEQHMGELTDATLASVQSAGQSPVARLAAYVAAGLRPPIVDPNAVSLWASFLNRVRHDERMRTTHERTYRDFRDQLEALIKDALMETGKKTDERELRRLAIACNAVIDGLWLEGGALPDTFEPDEPAQIGLASVSAIIGIELKDEVGTS
ncbi:TetR/AcrR family transcriptional regulator [Hoeflea sp. TYP-13]|uniref:TetR/AcrR family transcriptional regulator n=1 Tax=Hoeflea sp. TYP-13 TaxID=3230023 RepID=UPI0034C633A2